MKPIRISPEAESEIESSTKYYHDQSSGLENLFLDIIKASIEKIQKNPRRYPLIDTYIRRMIVQRIPFNIYYKEYPNEIVVLAIGHQKRKPGYRKR
jgi:toxin ParE1/3/4